MSVGLFSLPQVPAGEVAALQADVRYGKAGVHAIVDLQQYAGCVRGWVTVDTATTDAAGQAQFLVRRTTLGLRTYRLLVRTADGSGWQTALSEPRQIDVVTAVR